MERDPQIIPLFTAEEIADRVAELGAEITEDYAGKNPLLVGILKGAWMFLADLTRAMTIPHQCDFIRVSSYGSGTESSGEVRLLTDLSTPIRGRHVILIEDIVDTGHTLANIVNRLKEREPSSIAVCSLLDKPERREVAVHIDYLGFTVPNKFVVGYGLDWDERFRHLPYIGYLEFGE
ncbi:hypoxanthine phosphoribosyltransferase [candidate division TA06 bacterium B3_TA06]|uniref:Hypoxanthine phosphoribosyltransferase n=1 Tax=candidate division TA06 bacterium B3_TA06 TaxID=2012487 RepID=A0A532VAR8_UNCT6|nr:MAG: hypoxanthine phosphoribosyltransferase [candidate division TA06 bacterium B3_TA06]